PEPAHPGLVELEDALVASVRAARSEPEQLAYESAERYGYPAGFLARYFEKLRYRLGPRERAGLYTFLELARDVGELDDVPELRFVVATPASVRREKSFDAHPSLLIETAIRSVGSRPAFLRKEVRCPTCSRAIRSASGFLSR